LAIACGVSGIGCSKRIEWPSVPGRAYLVEGSANGVNWSPISGWILATGNLSTLSPTTGPGAPYLFRLQVRQ